MILCVVGFQETKSYSLNQKYFQGSAIMKNIHSHVEGVYIYAN